MRRLFPHLQSLSAFIVNDYYLGKIKVEVEGADDAVSNLTQESKLEIVVRLLDKLNRQLQAEKCVASNQG